MLSEFVRAVDRVLNAYGGQAHWESALGTNATLRDAYAAIHDHRNDLQHNGGESSGRNEHPVHEVGDVHRRDSWRRVLRLSPGLRYRIVAMSRRVAPGTERS
jgi:hypothetical protein